MKVYFLSFYFFFPPKKKEFGKKKQSLIIPVFAFFKKENWIKIFEFSRNWLFIIIKV
jgi:hypothetical protein